MTDGARSVVFEQAEDRLHSEKAVLMMLVGGPGEEIAGKRS